MSEVVCSNCGATFDKKEAKCPFCGYISYPGAEEKFMKDLEGIKDNLSDLSSIPNQEYKKEMSKQKKIVILYLKLIQIGVTWTTLFYRYLKMSSFNLKSYKGRLCKNICYQRTRFG